MDKLTTWFDGSSRLCRRGVKLKKWLDRRGVVDFFDVTVSKGVDYPAHRAELLAQLHAQENGVLLPGTDAFAAMRPIGLVASGALVFNLLESLCSAFLTVHPRLQRLVRRWDSA